MVKFRHHHGSDGDRSARRRRPTDSLRSINRLLVASIPGSTDERNRRGGAICWWRPTRCVAARTPLDNSRRNSNSLSCRPATFRASGHRLAPLRLHLEHSRLSLLRGFDELMCLEGLRGVEHLPHQIETVRKVLRHFRGRVLLADEVGLGKTIEACLLLREYLLRGIAKRVLILTPTPIVSQWNEELQSKFGLEFDIPPRTREPMPRNIGPGTIGC